MRTQRRIGVLSAAAVVMFSQHASAVNLATEGIGEAAVAPYYTVRDGWQTLINLTNTTDAPLVVKVRFRESYNGRDVLNFNVALAAFDVFTGVVRQNAGGIAEFAATDQPNDDGLRTCTVPSAVATTPQRLSPLGFSGGSGSASNDDDGIGGDNSDANTPNADAVQRLSEGYIEFVVMGYADKFYAEADDPVTFTGAEPASINTGNDPTGLAGAINVARAIEQHDCARLDQAFGNTVNAATGKRYIVDTARQMGEPINALKFNFRLLNAGRGTETGIPATIWENFFNPEGGTDADWRPLDDKACNITRGDYRSIGVEWSPNDNGVIGSAGSCNNLVATQTGYASLEPSLNDAFPAIANWWDGALNAARTVTADAASVATDGRARGIDAVSATIQRQAVINEWSSNSVQGVTTDWVITMPTKHFYVDQGQGQQAAVTLNDASVPAGAGNGRPEACIERASGSNYEAGHLALIGAVPAGNGADFDDDEVNDCEAVPYPPFARRFAQLVAGDRFTASSCNEFAFVFFDRAADRVPDEPPPVIVPEQPGAAESDNVCFEANVITFNSASALDAQRPINVDTSVLVPQAGWMIAWLDAEDVAGLDAVTDSSLRGLPVVGFNLKLRNFGDVTKNFSSSVAHAYIRQ